jgi:hypothetical protein
MVEHAPSCSKIFPDTQYRVQRYRAVHTNNMPILLLAMYFIIAWTQAFPDTAYNVWLNQVLKMPLSTQSDFYAFVFLPTMLKPVFGYLSDRYPICGSHRRSYIIICSFGSSAMYFITALLVESVPLAFAVTFLRAAFTSFAELMLGALLVEVVHKDPANAGSIQSLAITVRSLGSMSALVCGLAFYTCESTATPAAAKGIIATAGLFPLLNVFFTCCLGTSAKNKASKLDMSKRGAGKNDFTIVVFMMMIQAVLVWIGLKSFIGQPWFVEFGAWWRILVGMISFVALVALLFVACMKQASDPSNEAEAKQASAGISNNSNNNNSIPSSAYWHGCTALFLFLYNATPSAGVQLYSYELSLFSSRICYMQFLAIAGSASRCVAGILYGASQTVLRDEKPVHAAQSGQHGTIRILIATTFLASVASLLTLPLLPSVGITSIYSNIDHAFAYDMLTTCVVGVLSYMAFIPSVVLATQRAAVEHSNQFSEIAEQANDENVVNPDCEMGGGEVGDRTGGLESEAPLVAAAEQEVGVMEDAVRDESRALLVRDDSGIVAGMEEHGEDGTGRSKADCPQGMGMNTALLYGFYLSFIDFGDSAGGWISSDIVTRLGITYGGWSALWKLLVIGVVTKVGTLLFVPLLLVKRQGPLRR